jgi:hypothetical protein
MQYIGELHRKIKSVAAMEKILCFKGINNCNRLRQTIGGAPQPMFKANTGATTLVG